eukprot:TRINITY_DN13137_c0_g1_i4.p1 TRINITY_DN13137_c0_g1~~TRINITY_DN13137_c0_g1_i4.p1  ORF type:complete len:200 (-),score=42.80 TRINITY_DN13137_c0_g1_i4:16-615(-)
MTLLRTPQSSRTRRTIPKRLESSQLFQKLKGELTFNEETKRYKTNKGFWTYLAPSPATILLLLTTANVREANCQHLLREIGGIISGNTTALMKNNGSALKDFHANCDRLFGKYGIESPDKLKETQETLENVSLLVGDNLKKVLNNKETFEIVSEKAENMNRVSQHFQRQSGQLEKIMSCLLYTSPSPRDGLLSRMPSSA